MIWRARFPRRPPVGRIDQVIYYGGVSHMANLLFYAADLDTNQQVVVPQSAMPPAPPIGAAGGGLAGTYPNPTVSAVPNSALGADVVILSDSTYPPGDAHNLSNIPPPEIGQPGTCAVVGGALDALGQKVMTAGVDFPDPIGADVAATMVVSGANTTGILRVSTANVGPGGTITVSSMLGADDGDLAFVGLVGYLVVP